MKDSRPFSPEFTYTHAMVKRLASIAADREVILHAHLVPKWEVSIRREQLIRAAHASTAIEGNPLSLEEVSRLAEGREVMAARRAKTEVLNYLRVLEHARTRTEVWSRKKRSSHCTGISRRGPLTTRQRRGRSGR